MYRLKKDEIKRKGIFEFFFFLQAYFGAFCETSSFGTFSESSPAITNDKQQLARESNYEHEDLTTGTGVFLFQFPSAYN